MGKKLTEKQKFLAVVDAFFDPSVDTDHEIEMRWRNNYDGDTKWHTLFQEGGIARHGLFPHQADYRIKRHEPSR